MMQLYGVYRVYYSNEKGQICCQKVSDLIEAEPWISKGLFQMGALYGDKLKVARLPLPKKYKTLLVSNKK
jgi:hypothetical protein